MTIEEKIKIIENNKEKNYLFISPRYIQGGATLIKDAETLELYENMDSNTEKFAERKIIDLITKFKKGKEISDYLKLTLIFCGDFNDLPNDLGSLIDFIMNNKERIVAEYKYVKSTEERSFFIGFEQSEIIHHYGYLYLNFAKLLEEFDSNDIKYEMDTSIDNFTPSIYRDDTETKFVLNYEPKKRKTKRK